MKKILVIVVALIVGGAIGYFVYQYFFKDGSTPFGGGANGGSDVAIGDYKEPFMWGVTMRPTGLGNYNDSIWSKQLKVASNLGAEWVRFGWSYDASDEFGFHDQIINLIEQWELKPYLVIEPSGKFENVKDPYSDGYENAKKIASHYKGKIKYYQIMNEAGSNALKGPEYSGEDETDYDATKYERTKEWIRGASEGVKEADPNAYRVITNQWLQTAFLEKLKQDNIEYEIIGWDWFSDMGFMGDKKLSDGTYLIEKLKSFEKPVILAEVNQRPDGDEGQDGQNEEEQAVFIKKMADWSVEQGLKGFIVLELLDIPNSGKGYTDYYGIVGVEKSSGGSMVPGEPRQAYSIFQEIIQKYK